MVSRDVWFGTRGNMQWIPAPAVDMQGGKMGWAAEANFLGGGAWVRRSKTSSKVFSMSWNMKHQEEIQPVLDYADGYYGNGFMYYTDPFAQGRNVMPSYMAAPYMNYYDGPFVWDNKRPTIVDNGSSIGGLPVESAEYTVTSDSNVPLLYIPVPPGYEAHIGVHGSVTSGDVTAQLHVWTGAGTTATDMTLLGYGDALTNEVVDGNVHHGFSISFVSDSTGTIKLDGMIAQVLLNGSVSPVGAFISGQGQSGMAFKTQPVVSPYSAALDRVGVNADLAEVEAWTWQ